jgi:hypothetical protein
MERLNADESKAKLIELVAEGLTIEAALKIIGKSRQTYDYYRKTDKQFVEDIERSKIIAGRDKGKIEQAVVPDFPEFCKEYLNLHLSKHQLNWYEALEGREPTDLHPSCIYTKGIPQYLIVNTPPGHAKSETLTVAYSVWQIVKNPDVKIVIVSETQNLAKKMLLRIKNILTSDLYKKLQTDFAPKGDWKKGSSSWTAYHIYIGNKSIEDKDPTVQAIGIGSQLYGTRADFIILDDCVSPKNAKMFEDQRQWVQEIVNSRLSKDGKILVIGTRIATNDLYMALQDPEYYYNNTSPWTYLLQPAVLEYAEDPKDWVTLWPKSNIPWSKDEEPDEEGLYPRWGGIQLNNIRNRMTAGGWSRIYMQQQISSDNVFKESDVKACTSGRAAGIIPNNEIAGRAGGMNGLYIIGGVDPAASGFTAMTIYGVDIPTGNRYVIDLYNKAGTTPEEMKTAIKDFTLKYSVREWRIENNAFQSYLTNDNDLKTWLASRGSLLVGHHTGSNKNDPELGVMAMTSLFEQRLISLPSSRSNEEVMSLINQLITWKPDLTSAEKKRIKTDMVMSLWFCELRALELVLRSNAENSFRDSKYTTAYSRNKRKIISANPIEINPYSLQNYRFGRNR